MTRIDSFRWPILLVIALVFTGRWSGECQAQNRLTAAAERYQLLLKEMQLASSGGRLTEEERLQFIGRTFRHRQQFAHMLIDLAEANPEDPVALDALIQSIWYVNTEPWPVELIGDDTARGRAFAILLSDYVGSDRLGKLCLRIAGGYAEEYESFLRAVSESNPDPNVRALAEFSLAKFLHRRLQFLELVDERPELAQRFVGLFGAAYIEPLFRVDRSKLKSEVESLFERVASQRADVSLPDGGTVGERARADLFELQHLSVGQTAPEISGLDQDGQLFRLSDYRGKVVLLDFWHQQ